MGADHPALGWLERHYQNDEPYNPGGDGFMRLHEWFLGPDGEFARPSQA